jgi:proteasome lid subunit RPN8/RPN11
MICVENSLLKELTGRTENLAEECCGFFFGHETDDRRTILKTISASNVSPEDRRFRFTIAKQDYLLAEQYADQHNMQLLGIYHSHPNQPAVPSERDRAAAQPYFSYIIISTMNNKFADIRAWVLNDNKQFFEEPLLITYKLHNRNGNRNHSYTA